MPKKIKIFLTSYIIIIGSMVILFENKFGQNSYIFIVAILTITMIIGIWIFPEVVTKKLKDKKNNS